MTQFKASEFQGLVYDVPPGASYQQILAEAVSERERIRRVGGSLQFAQLVLATSNAGRRMGVPQYYDGVDEAVQILSEAGDAGPLAWGYWSKANHCQLVGLHADASHFYEKAFHFALEARCPDAARYAIAGKTEIDRIRGQYAVAIPMHLKARELFRSVNDYRGVVWADEGLGQMALRRGRLPEGHRHFANALSNAIMIGDNRGIAWANRGLAEVVFRSGDLPSGKVLAVDAFDGFKQSGVLVGAGYAKLTLARISCLEKDEWAAKAEISDAENIFLQTGHKRGLFWSKRVASSGVSDL